MISKYSGDTSNCEHINLRNCFGPTQARPHVMWAKIGHIGRMSVQTMPVNIILLEDEADSRRA